MAYSTYGQYLTRASRSHRGATLVYEVPQIPVSSDFNPTEAVSVRGYHWRSGLMLAADLEYLGFRLCGLCPGDWFFEW